MAASLLIVTAWLGVIAAQMIAAGKILSVLWPESFDLLTVYTAGVVVPVIFGFYSRRSALHADGATAAIVGGGLVGGAKCRGETISSLPRFFSAALLFGVSYEGGICLLERKNDMENLPWMLVNDSAKIAEARSHIEAATLIGVDTEYDSFRYFKEKLCLVQVATDSRVYLFDPLAEYDFSFLGCVFENSGIIKVLHACDNDVRILNRDYGFVFSSLFDNHRAAELLGSTALSLPAVLEEYLGEVLPKNKMIQRSRWDRRPLTEDQLTYAASDAACLVPLYRAMVPLLRERGLDKEARRLFDEIAAGRWRDKKLTPGGYRKIEGYEDLDEAARRRLEALWRWRFEKARATNRARFLILSDQNLVNLARRGPRTLEELSSLGLFSDHRFGEYGPELLRVLGETGDES